MYSVPVSLPKSEAGDLGLSLAKRIVEEYHHGKIWVKSTEVGTGNHLQNRTEEGGDASENLYFDDAESKIFKSLKNGKNRGIIS